MIEHFAPQMIRGGNGGPTLLAQSRAYVECGCSVFVGTWLHNHEPGVGAAMCSEHADLAQAVNEAYLKTLDDPTDRLAVEVAEEVLTTVALSRGG